MHKVFTVRILEDVPFADYKESGFTENLKLSKYLHLNCISFSVYTLFLRLCPSVNYYNMTLKKLLNGWFSK